MNLKKNFKIKNKLIYAKDILFKDKKNLKDLILKTQALYGVQLHLVILQINNDIATNKYIKNKIQFAKDINVKITLIKLPTNITAIKVIKVIKDCNKDKNIHGIILQLPLPNHLNSQELIEYISPNKDVDCLTSANIGIYNCNLKQFYPAVSSSILQCFKNFNINIKGKNVAIVGQSLIIGKPLINFMVNNKSTVISCNKFTNNLKHFTKQADILIVGVGVKNLINHEMIKPNSIVFDIGTSYEKNKVFGDVLLDEKMLKKVKLITPVPGGIGPLTVYNLFKNLLSLYLEQNK